MVHNTYCPCKKFELRKEIKMNRRIGYAEKEGLAIIRKERARQRRNEAIGISVAGSIAITFFWICFCIWAQMGA